MPRELTVHGNSQPVGVATAATVLDARGQEVVAATTDGTLTLEAQAGTAYLFKKASDPIPSRVEVSGRPATALKKLAPRTIGL